MIGLAFQTIRTRWKLFLGTFVALTFGIAVMASMFNILVSVDRNRPLQGTPTRYDAASVVVAADQKLHVQQGDGSEQATTLAEWKQIPANTGNSLAGISGIQQIVADRGFMAMIVNKQGATQSEHNQTGHGWSSAQLTPFHLIEGSAPQPGEVVITEAIVRNAHISIADVVSVSTPAGLRSFKISGIVRTAQGDQLPGEDTLFFADADARALSGRPDKIDAVVIVAAPGQNIAELQKRIAAALPDKSLQVKTGANKGGNVAADIYAKAVQSVTELIGFNIGITGFVCIFVVAGTTAFAITQRRQEMALLRLVGVTPKQIRRMILGETSFIALAAAIAGSLLGALFSSALASLLKQYELAPQAFTAGGTWLGTLVASGIGIVVAFIGVFFASRRAGKVRAAEAMRDAVAEQQIMTRGRWITGMIFFALSVGIVLLMLVLGGVIAMALAVLVTEMLAVALALLMPVFVKPLISFMTIRLVKKTNVVGMLTRANLRGAVRRTTSTAAPILIAVSITISMVGVNVTVAKADQRNLEDRTLASHILTGKMPLQTIDEARRIPDVASVVGVSSSVLYPAADVSSTPVDYGALDLSTLAGTFKIDVQSGSLQHLGKNDIVVSILNSQDTGWKVGRIIPVFLADGAKADLRVAAVVNMPMALPGALLSPELAAGHISSPMVENLFVRTSARAGASTDRALSHLADKTGAKLQTKQAWFAEKTQSSARETQLAMIIMLGLALAYLSIAIANTLLMAVSGRTRDLELLRKLGITDRQILSMVAWETIVVTAIGSILGTFTASLTIMGVYGAISKVVPGTPIPFVRPVYFAAIIGSLLVALLASVIPTARQLHKNATRTE